CTRDGGDPFDSW
nr:immunoglobulin heavy chain junction region [Macaca mulatta]